MESNIFILQEICRFLGLNEISKLSRSSKSLRKVILDNENIWGNQYLREAHNFPLTMKGKPSSWRLIYLMQKSRKSYLSRLNEQFEVRLTRPWDNSLGIPKSVGKRFLVTWDGKVYSINDNQFELVHLEFSITTLIEQNLTGERMSVLLLTSEGEVYQGPIIRSTQNQQLIFSRRQRHLIISDVVQIKKHSCRYIYRRKDGEIWVSGSCVFGSFGPDYHYSDTPVPLFFPEKIENVQCSLSGTCYIGESGTCYFGGQLYSPDFQNNTRTKNFWTELPDLPPSKGRIVSVAIGTDLIYILSSCGFIYTTQLTENRSSFSPYQLLEGWNCVVEIRLIYTELLIRTLSGRFYLHNRFSISRAVPLIGLEKLSNFNMYWLTTNYFSLDSRMASKIQPLIIHREPYGDKFIWVDIYGNRYLH